MAYIMKDDDDDDDDDYDYPCTDCAVHEIRNDSLCEALEWSVRCDVCWITNTRASGGIRNVLRLEPRSLITN
jgi:hypothetical protein